MVGRRKKIVSGVLVFSILALAGFRGGLGEETQYASYRAEGEEESVSVRAEKDAESVSYSGEEAPGDSVCYHVVTSPREHAVEKGVYHTFEEALKASTASHKWYVTDAGGNIVYPSPAEPAQQIEKACLFLEAIAPDERHGFCLDPAFEQGQEAASGRYGLFYPYENGDEVKSRLAGLGEYGNYNCSTAQIAAYTWSGYADLFGSGATGVGNFREAALENGFADAADQVDFATGEGLKRGDILVYVADDSDAPDKPAHSHMATYLGNGRIMWCTGDLDKGRHGDTSGREMYIREYIDWDWQAVMRPVRTERGSTRQDITEIDGTDWAPVYDYDYYLANNPDVAERYGGDYMLTLRHFVRYGIGEGRQGCAFFNVEAYKYYNPDLVRRFGISEELNYRLYSYYARHAADDGDRRAVW